jgi:hypothetical protein
VSRKAERAGPNWAVLPLDGPGCLVLAVGALVTEVTGTLDKLCAEFLQ